ncbi:MAG: hypothetical protein NT102_07095 [Caldiserica bacterium]|nr:hypothetical protein [Caldisericota bacterium]
MNLKRQYAVLAGVLAIEAFVFALFCGIALHTPGAGAVGFLVAAAIVFYYSVRHPTPFGVAAGLFNTLLLSYFSQSRELPTALLLLLVTGASPYIEQLAPGLARIAFTGAYAVTALVLAFFTRGSAAPGLAALLRYCVAAAVTGLVGSRYLVRRSPLEQSHG